MWLKKGLESNGTAAALKLYKANALLLGSFPLVWEPTLKGPWAAQSYKAQNFGSLTNIDIW